MNGPEIHPAVDANNVQAQRNAKAFSEATKRAVAEATAFAEMVNRRNRKKATTTVIRRTALVTALITLVCQLCKHGLMDGELTLFTIIILCAMLLLWFGAYVEFMWGARWRR